MYYYINIKINKVKVVDFKNCTYCFLDDMINTNILIQIKSRQTKSHTKIFLFTTLATQKGIVEKWKTVLSY